MRGPLRRATVLALLMLMGMGPTVEAMPTEWPTIQGNFARTGFHGDIHGPGTGEIVWRFETGGLSIRGVPAVADHRVFFGGSDEYVYAVNATTGELEWRFRMPGPVEQSLVVDADHVYAPGADDALYALNSRTGELQWTYEALGISQGHATVNRSAVYIAAAHGIVHAVDRVDGTGLWTYDIGQYDDQSTRPGQILPMGDKIILSGPRGAVVGLSAENGSKAWLIDVDTIVGSPLATDGHVAFVPTVDRNIHAIDPSNGSQVRVHSPPITDVTITYDDGVLFMAGPQGIVALDTETLGTLWQVDFSGLGGRFITASDSAVYVAVANGWVRALDRTNGQELWKHQIAMWIESSPVVVDGLLYIGTDQFRMFALDAGAGGPFWAPPDEPGEPLPGVSPAVVLFSGAAIAALAGRSRGRPARQEPLGGAAR